MWLRVAFSGWRRKKTSQSLLWTILSLKSNSRNVLCNTFHKDRAAGFHFTLDIPVVRDCAFDRGVTILLCWGEGQESLCLPVSMTQALVARDDFSWAAPAERRLVGWTGVSDRALKDCRFALKHRRLSLQIWFWCFLYRNIPIDKTHISYLVFFPLFCTLLFVNKANIFKQGFYNRSHKHTYQSL